MFSTGSRLRVAQSMTMQYQDNPHRRAPRRVKLRRKDKEKGAPRANTVEKSRSNSAGDGTRGICTRLRALEQRNV